MADAKGSTDLERLTETETLTTFSLTARALRDLRKEGIPRNDDGSYSASRVHAWLVERKTAAGTLDAQRSRLAKEQADRASMENAVRRGELLEAAELETVWARIVKSIREKVLALPTRTAAELAKITDANVIRRRLTDEIHEILAEAAAYRPGGASADRRRIVPRRARAADSATAADGQRVG